MARQVPSGINVSTRDSSMEEITHPCDSISEHGFSTARGSMKEDTTRRLNTSV